MRLTTCDCRAEHYRRVRRKSWMRLVKSRRLYHCLACEAMLFLHRDDVGGRPFEDTVAEMPTQPQPLPGPSAA